MNSTLTTGVREALRPLSSPWTGVSLAEAGCDIVVAGSRATVTIEVPSGAGAEAETLRLDAEAAAMTVEGVNTARAILTAHRTAGPAQKPQARGGHAPIGTGKGAPKGPIELPGVRSVVAVASGKGGVGKSTVAANLAVGLAKKGLKVGLLDADIYGPSAPVLFALQGRAEVKDEKIVPREAFGVRIMSIGLMLDADKALVWRGPMVMGAVSQMLADTGWGELDVLVVDTPPGTGDAHLTLAQKAPLTGVVIVTTPQELALADARRGAEMFRTLKVPVIGVVENMSFMEAPDGTRLAPFGEGGGAALAQTLDAPLLAQLPLDPRLRETGDAGAPLLTNDETSVAAQALYKIVAAVAAAIPEKKKRFGLF